MTAEQKSRLREKIDAGVKAAIADALEEHRRAGRKVAIYRDGQVVLVLPDPPEASDNMALREDAPKH